MSTQWLTIQSFQQSQELLSAINTLSIHHKLTDKGYLDTNRKESAEQAIEILAAFFQKLDKIIQNIEDGHRKPIVGVDTRLRHLAENYVQAKRAQSHSPFLEFPLSQFRELFYSESTEGRGKVLVVLAAFRELLEEHVGADAKRLMGDI